MARHKKTHRAAADERRKDFSIMGMLKESRGKDNEVKMRGKKEKQRG